MTSTNPDNEIKSSTLGLLGSSLPLALLYVLILMVLFSQSKNLPFFNIFFWIIFPITVYLIGSIMNIINQLIVCKKTNIGQAFLGGIPIVISVLVAMGIGIIDYCRIPVVSALAPLFYGNTVDVISNTNIRKSNKSNGSEMGWYSNPIKKFISTKSKMYGGSCCQPTMSLEKIENDFPMIKGISIGFYVIFGVLFGNIFGNGISITC